MYLGYIHTFRALAILFIIFGHSIDAMTWHENHETSRLLRIFFSNGSVLFVFIAGYLFQHLIPKYSHRKYFKNKLTNVITPYLIISIPAIIAFVFFLERERVWEGFYQNPQWAQAAYFYLTGRHLAPLWFIPMITIFYLCAPLLVKLDTKKYFYYLIPILIITSCLIQRGLPHQSFVHFFSAYVLGMYCSHYKTIINGYIKTKGFLAGAFFVIILLGLAEFYLVTGTMTWINYLQKITASIFYLGLFIALGDKIKSQLINTIAAVSFGTFFIHSYILTGSKIIYSKAFGALPAGDPILFGAISISTLLVCTYIIVFIKRIFKDNSKYLVGS